MNKKEAIDLLNNEGWAKADAKRALELLDFKLNPDIDELAIRRAASKFAGAELDKRQRLQRGQKIQVTKKNKEIQRYITLIEELAANGGSSNQEEIKKLRNKISELVKVNDDLKKDNKVMKDIVDKIRFKLTVEIKNMLNLKDSQVKKSLVKLLKSTLG
ncbi:MAG: hypothetical protein AAGF83_22235 [Cyanobacteria bacterium P01_G01_bin.67]